jgi:putative tricarboxylic transport membrane protein
VVIMTLFGLIGYIMKKVDYEAAPLVLALVLGPMMENALRRSLVISEGNFKVFLTRPISAFFLISGLLILFSPLFLKKNKLRGKIAMGSD